MSTLDAVRARFARNEGLPFADILTEASIRDIREMRRDFQARADAEALAQPAAACDVCAT